MLASLRLVHFGIRGTSVLLLALSTLTACGSSQAAATHGSAATGTEPQSSSNSISSSTPNSALQNGVLAAEQALDAGNTGFMSCEAYKSADVLADFGQLPSTEHYINGDDSDSCVYVVDDTFSGVIADVNCYSGTATGQWSEFATPLDSAKYGTSVVGAKVRMNNINPPDISAGAMTPDGCLVDVSEGIDKPESLGHALVTAYNNFLARPKGAKPGMSMGDLP